MSAALTSPLDTALQMLLMSQFEGVHLGSVSLEKEEVQ